MAENGGVACKCTERGIYGFDGTRFDKRSRIRKNLRNVSLIPLFKHNGLFIWRSIAANNCIFSMDAREKSRSTTLETSRHKRVPIFVMMPVDSFGFDTSGAPMIRRIKALTISLKALKLAGVHGIAVEVWWGIVERFSPFVYNWSLYEELFKLISESGFKLHVALSFHSNMHSSSRVKGGVSLPLWIVEIGDLNKDIYYRDQNGFSNGDYLTLGVDELPLFCGRTALQCYEDFMFSFINKFESFIGSVIEEISVGLGPSGELRYPAHPFGDGRWRFPGIGEFQCYDKYMMEDLKIAACQEGKPQWGDKGPQNAGCYNSLPSGVPFFEEGQESFLSDYGCFFLEWYSGRLIRHADAILTKAANMLKKYQESKKSSVLLVAKIGGIYWWYHTLSHPAELTAGYYNTALRDGYDPVASMLSRHGAALHISCLEMMDNETPPTYLCSPERLLQQFCRYLFYLGKIRTIQLEYTDAKESLLQAARKAPAAARGFRIQCNKWAIIVRLLLGEIPERTVFMQKGMEKALRPYFELTNAVRIGDLELFRSVAEKFAGTFSTDRIHNLIVRLRHNVIRTGLRNISISYSRISLADIASKLRLDSANPVADAESIVAKAIHDGAIDATLDHSNGWMVSKETGDIYSTIEPQIAFNSRITFCLNMHNEAVRALRYPPNTQKEKESAEKRRERQQQEQELAKHIAEEEDDDF